jgi:hypothetical protein
VDEATPRVDGYYAKVVNVGKTFQTKGDEAFTEVTVTFGSGPERKAMLLDTGWHLGDIVLVENENGDYQNWSRNSKIVPRPLAWL